MSGAVNVSRETLERLEVYSETLKKWNPRINLVAKSTIDDLWNRHIVDSLQVLSHIPEQTHHLVDLGSGGGFPGLVIAIAATESGNPSKVTMIESDQRKSAFLRTVLRETATTAEIMTQRIEETPSQNAQVITARALADLSTLLGFAELHLAPDGKAIFLKGKNWRSELATAQEAWQFDWNEIQSETSDEAVLLEIKGIKRV
ncbi:16S rRNA (guanine(527)-N(7))-methyltransferase RsmG [Lentibacter sp. XHP0401]|uniref:16S rRNA (guanine(527)-N(7))-methyltransferase RsmG n=1 Tax=Lentibacter sp. XHP0401 TaxID=2984334 RepID=UPI0021E9ADB1|nr:16S rRNA (guanine(527)-N(7))-methyltransferase RsmG [Lentibacter sp. XHP0401]MCV2892594.1 16S rRNA (guanine(527)-N(7))-methyltransferase RsmG [Lentibacter sp. XHP0401]